MRVVISGSSGLIGSALADDLAREGHEVLRLVRRAPAEGESRWHPAAGKVDPAAFDGCDAVVNLAGVGIGDRRWSDERKRAIVESRVAGTTLLSDTIANLSHRPRVFVNASAVGIYGDRGAEILTEDSPPGEGFLADLCTRWEAATSSAERAGVRTVHVRSAVVLDRHGGALAKQLPLFRAGLGGRLGKGDQWFSWITLRDEVRGISHILRTEALSGPVNCSAPEPVTNARFTRSLSRYLHRPAFFAVPRAALRLTLGRGLADELVMSSLRVVPSRLSASGFEFEDGNLEESLPRVLSKS